MTQKMFKYNKPASEEGKKAPMIICYANNEAHAMQVLRERFKKEKEDGTYEYETPVSYWMPFNGGIGFHDASWQPTFGGSRYLTNGSHGCVNTPEANAEKIINNIEKGVPVVVY